MTSSSDAIDAFVRDPSEANECAVRELFGSPEYIPTQAEHDIEIVRLTAAVADHGLDVENLLVSVRIRLLLAASRVKEISEQFATMLANEDMHEAQVLSKYVNAVNASIEMAGSVLYELACDAVQYNEVVLANVAGPDVVDRLHLYTLVAMRDGGGEVSGDASHKLVSTIADAVRRTHQA